MDIDQLIRDDEVHRDVYVSEEVFALEMDRIFGSAWIYVGHDSQIPEPGDYWTTRVGLRVGGDGSREARRDQRFL